MKVQKENANYEKLCENWVWRCWSFWASNENLCVCNLYISGSSYYNLDWNSFSNFQTRLDRDVVEMVEIRCKRKKDFGGRREMKGDRGIRGSKWYYSLYPPRDTTLLAASNAFIWILIQEFIPELGFGLGSSLQAAFLFLLHEMPAIPEFLPVFGTSSSSPLNAMNYWTTGNRKWARARVYSPFFLFVISLLFVSQNILNSFWNALFRGFDDFKIRA